MQLYLLRMYGDIAKQIHNDELPDDTDIFLTKDLAFEGIEQLKDEVDEEDDKLVLYEVELNAKGGYDKFELIWGFWGWHYKIPDNFMQGLKFENKNDYVLVTIMKDVKSVH